MMSIRWEKMAEDLLWGGIDVRSSWDMALPKLTRDILAGE
jgi:hypothetical protein